MIRILLVLVLVTACSGKNNNHSRTTPSEITSRSPSDNKAIDPHSITIIEEFSEKINDHRLSLGLGTLTFNDSLNAIAQKHSEDMANGSIVFGHAGFSSRCSEAKSSIGGGNLCSENVAKGQVNVQAVWNSWMNSSGHKSNIEQPRVTHSGFGYAKSSSGVWYWTEIFIEEN